MPQCFTYLCLPTTFYLKCYSPVPLVEGGGAASYRRDLDMFIPSGVTRQQVGSQGGITVLNLSENINC